MEAGVDGGIATNCGLRSSNGAPWAARRAVAGLLSGGGRASLLKSLEGNGGEEGRRCAARGGGVAVVNGPGDRLRIGMRGRDR